ncbi:hypothetical protein AB0C21_34735 [Spirillospora sp. NPDC049024]|uniref:hypothetical protein n=1 Tax=unclassified Actinomadura TaxID=2626254 RepID=UPI0011ED2F35|nr:hypothetical protein [Actinomadura sp. K4S16]
MTTPEENAPKTDDTDQAARKPGGKSGRKSGREPERRPDVRTELGAELEDKMSEKGLSRDDFSGS